MPIAPTARGWLPCLLYIAGSTTVYATCGLLFAIAATLMLTIRHASPPRRERATWETLLAGVTYVRSNPVVLGAISLDLFAVLLGGVGSIAIALLWWRRFPSLATRDHMVRPA